jgi:hypothetical protein
MSQLVEKLIHGDCPECKFKLPPLEREGSFGGWGIVDCPNPDCDQWFDVQRYLAAGGIEV